MKSRMRGLRPSPAIVVAVMALIAAVAGTAVAGPGATTSKITKKKVNKIAAKVANQEIDERAPGLSVANAAQLDGRPAVAFDTASASDVQTADQALTGAHVPVLSTNVTVPSGKRVTATATIEMESNGGTNDNANCRFVIAGVQGPLHSTVVTPNGLDDSTVLPLTFSSVVGTGTHTVQVTCNQGVGSETTATNRVLSVVATN
jgi:hypothetical protein